jgi:hypothetical protein
MKIPQMQFSVEKGQKRKERIFVESLQWYRKACMLTEFLYKGSHLILTKCRYSGNQSSDTLGYLLLVTQLALERERILIPRFLASKLYQTKHTLE